MSQFGQKVVVKILNIFRPLIMYQKVQLYIFNLASPASIIEVGGYVYALPKTHWSKVAALVIQLLNLEFPWCNNRRGKTNGAIYIYQYLNAIWLPWKLVPAIVTGAGEGSGGDSESSSSRLTLTSYSKSTYLSKGKAGVLTETTLFINLYLYRKFNGS